MTAKLTAKQFEVLKAMNHGAILVWLTHARDNPSEYLSHSKRSIPFTVRVGTSDKLRKLGLIKLITDPQWTWRSKDYVITEAGKEYVRRTTEGARG